MVILKYELKRHRKYILGWAIALALCVFVMTAYLLQLFGCFHRRPL